MGRKSLNLKWLVYSLLICLYPLRAQQMQPYMRSYTVADGLPSNEVYCVFQDSQGFLWFGTDAGVCRYDGSVFQTFTQRDGLPDHTIFGVFEDRRGRIWFRAFNGLLSWYEHGRIVQPPVNTKLRERLSEKYVLSEVIDQQDLNSRCVLSRPRIPIIIS